ncbi:hypothetical protein [Solimicrobium silvestre]|uniref:Uncharacterized protein n=1 Tax=Solimicrobium silvestre TaxID=2099400 RepID=A0A2S9H3H7_9BURK|nr:hypothetical protein [Solimicrobium silvestre]PRC94521.1 hypothetical protein S2091_0524 [Solimicrobium silvestre]
MKIKLQQLARQNGQHAAIKAKRVAIILTLPVRDAVSQRWLKMEALRVAKTVEYHLRQANLIGQLIERMDEKIRLQHQYPDRAFKINLPYAPN